MILSYTVLCDRTAWTPHEADPGDNMEVELQGREQHIQEEVGDPLTFPRESHLIKSKIVKGPTDTALQSPHPACCLP